MSGVRTFIRVFHIVKYNYVIYLEYHSVCPLVRIGGPPTPSLAGEEVGGPNSDDWRKGALCLLCDTDTTE